MSKIVIALGGNALGSNPAMQMDLLENVAKILVNLIKEGHKIVLTHGNGPQVGQIALAMEYANQSGINTPPMPFPECGSMSQGYIGYQLQQALQDELERQKIKKNCVTLITQVLVSEEDEAFLNPTKPIGMFYPKEDALKIAKEKKQIFKEDAGRGYRRVVPSPKPIDIIEADTIKLLVENDVLVISVGGGGIPVIKSNSKELLEGVEAVIDKDMSSSLLAKKIEADILLILTSVSKVCLNFDTKNPIPLDEIRVEDALKYIENKEFKEGSMLPKIKACIDFVSDKKENIAIITSLNEAGNALNGNVGTKIIN